MSNIAHAPISSPLNSQTYQMWFESVGRHLNNATTIKTKTSTDGNSKVNYVLNGSICYLTYTGTGGFDFVLPVKAKHQAVLTVSDGTTLIILEGSKVLTVPTYIKSVTIQGNYFNEA